MLESPPEEEEMATHYSLPSHTCPTSTIEMSVSPDPHLIIINMMITDSSGYLLAVMEPISTEFGGMTMISAQHIVLMMAVRKWSLHHCCEGVRVPKRGFPGSSYCTSTI